MQANQTGPNQSRQVPKSPENKDKKVGKREKIKAWVKNVPVVGKALVAAKNYTKGEIDQTIKELKDKSAAKKNLILDSKVPLLDENLVQESINEGINTLNETDLDVKRPLSMNLREKLITNSTNLHKSYEAKMKILQKQLVFAEDKAGRDLITEKLAKEFIDFMDADESSQKLISEFNDGLISQGLSESIKAIPADKLNKNMEVKIGDDVAKMFKTHADMQKYDNRRAAQLETLQSLKEGVSKGADTALKGVELIRNAPKAATAQLLEFTSKLGAGKLYDWLCTKILENNAEKLKKPEEPLVPAFFRKNVKPMYQSLQETLKDPSKLVEEAALNIQVKLLVGAPIFKTLDEIDKEFQLDDLNKKFNLVTTELKSVREEIIKLMKLTNKTQMDEERQNELINKQKVLEARASKLNENITQDENDLLQLKVVGDKFFRTSSEDLCNKQGDESANYACVKSLELEALSTRKEAKDTISALNEKISKLDASTDSLEIAKLNNEKNIIIAKANVKLQKIDLFILKVKDYV